MITKRLANLIRKVYKDSLTDLQCRLWHSNECSTHEKIRQMAVATSDRLTDGRLAAILYDRHELPGNFGQTWCHGKPTPLWAPFNTVKGEFRKLLSKAARAESISKEEYDSYLATLSAAGITVAVANRFVASCFPSQLSAVVVPAEMDSLFGKLVKANPSPVRPKSWFEKNETTTRWIQEAIPGTDDAWRSVVAWRLH